VICELPDTGLGAYFGLLLLLAISCLIAGVTLVLLARRSRGGLAVLVLLLLLGTVTTVSTLGMVTPAQAATPGCSPPPSSSSSSGSSSSGSALSGSSASGSSSASSPSAPPSTASSSVGRLTVTQTSTMAGLAPGVAPTPITGRLVNHSAESTHITAVGVEIASITPGFNSSAGACGVGDYEVIAARMRVGRTLGPEGSTAFAGASIGFNNKKTNQDGCQGATVHLLYTTNPR
jgi:hypothetical protein